MPMFPLGDQMSYCLQTIPVASVFNDGFVVPPGVKPLTPFHSMELQTADACPRNFVIFDQSINRNHITLHPETSFLYPGFGVDVPIFHSDVDHQNNANDESKRTSQLKEDSDDINALLSTEYEETQECDDEDAISTARTGAIYECKSPDSCSNYESPSRKNTLPFRISSWSCSDDQKRQRIRKMMKSLRSIVPGGNRLSTIALLDEAVRYLKSLRVEAKKLGAGNLKG